MLLPLQPGRAEVPRSFDVFDSSPVQLVMRSTDANGPPNADRLQDQVQLFDEHQQHRKDQGEA